jgi:hypothetical protein
LMGKTGFSIGDGALGGPCSRGPGWEIEIPLTNDGELGQIMPGSWWW